MNDVNRESCREVAITSALMSNPRARSRQRPVSVKFRLSFTSFYTREEFLSELKRETIDPPLRRRFLRSGGKPR